MNFKKYRYENIGYNIEEPFSHLNFYIKTELGIHSIKIKKDVELYFKNLCDKIDYVNLKPYEDTFIVYGFIKHGETPVLNEMSKNNNCKLVKVISAYVE